MIGKTRIKLKLFTVILIAFLLAPMVALATHRTHIEEFPEDGGTSLFDDELVWVDGRDALAADSRSKNTTIIVGHSYPQGASNNFRRGAFFFDLTDVPANATINNATLTIPVRNTLPTQNNSFYVVYDSNGVYPRYAASVDLRDYNVSNYDTLIGAFSNLIGFTDADFREWKLSVPTTNITTGVDAVTMINFDRQFVNMTLFYPPHGDGEIPANFTQQFTLTITGITSGTQTYRAWLGFSEIVDDWDAINDASDALGVMIQGKLSTTEFDLGVLTANGGASAVQDLQTGFLVDTTYYCTWTRSYDTFTLQVYNDTARTSLVATSTYEAVGSNGWDLNYVIMPGSVEFSNSRLLNGTISDYHDFTWTNYTIDYPAGLVSQLTKDQDNGIMIFGESDWLNTSTIANETSIFRTGAATQAPILTVGYTETTSQAQVDAVSISNLDPPSTIEADGYLFTNEKFYNFEVDAHTKTTKEMDFVIIRFTDGYQNIRVACDIPSETFSILSGEEYITLRQGTISNPSAGKYNLTFQIMLKDTLADAYSVDVDGWANSTDGATNNWENNVLNDGFNIYNLGGHSIQTIFGTAAQSGFTVGGEPWNMWANLTGNGYMNEMEYRYIQHIMWNPTFVTPTDPADTERGYFEYGIKPATDQFAEGFRVRITPTDLEGTPVDQVEMNVKWQYYSGGIWNNLTSDLIAGAYLPDVDESYWFINFWVDRDEGGTRFSGVVGCQYYNDPLLNTPKPTSSSAAVNILNRNDGVMPISNSSMMRVWEKVMVTDTTFLYNITEVKYSIRQGTPEGVDTPELTPAKTMTAGWNPFAFLYKAISNLGKTISSALSYGVIGILTQVIGWMDTLASALGVPLLFTNMATWVTSLWARVTSLTTYTFNLFIPLFSFITVGAGKYVYGVTAALGIWTSWIENIILIFTGGFNMGINLWTAFNLSTWFLVACVFYPLYLLELGMTKGFDAAANQVSWMAKLIMSLIMFTLTLMDSLFTLIQTFFSGVDAVK